MFLKHNVSKLSAVLQRLAQNAIPKDDTMLEKLFALLERSDDSGDASMV